MFENLSNRLTSIFDKLKRHGKLSEADVTAALREVRIALLEADVALPVVKTFIEDVKKEAIGQEVLQSIHPSQMVIKIVHDHLVRLLDSDNKELNLAGSPPVVILMVGLQGSGKTTTTAKLAHILSQKNNKKVLMASLDIYRPAAQHQLDVLGKSIQVATLPIIPAESPLQITKRALKVSKMEGYDILLLDTAGRLHIDNALMDEISQIKALSNPLETLLIADAMTGQDAAHIAKTFQEKIGLTGLILTRIDGDARGGAALSMRSIAHVPIKFLGMGEKIDQLEVFHPDRLANRILGMGDVVSLVEKAMETIDQQEAQDLAKKMQKGSFDLNDMALQLKQISKMGGMSGVMSLLPGIGKMKDKIETAGLDDRFLKRQLAIISSMTPQEKRDPRILNASRKRRVSSGSGTTIQDINKLLKQYRDMETMMKRMGKLGKKGFLRQGIGGLFSR
ncbi:MAG: signal recognition particle protein [Proteobacteria bacterium]|nr:signal recognition particle protein [Pseudomonadota bacterium]